MKFDREETNEAPAYMAEVWQYAIECIYANSRSIDESMVLSIDVNDKCWEEIVGDLFPNVECEEDVLHCEVYPIEMCERIADYFPPIRESIMERPPAGYLKWILLADGEIVILKLSHIN